MDTAWMTAVKRSEIIVQDSANNDYQKNDNENVYAYQYDKAGNRTSEQTDNAVTSALYNTLNQETTQQSGGPMRFAGNVNEFSDIIVTNATTQDSAKATVDSATNKFEAFVK